MSQTHFEKDIPSEQNPQSAGGSTSSVNEKPQQEQNKQTEDKPGQHVKEEPHAISPQQNETIAKGENPPTGEVRPVERKGPARPGARGTAAMDPKTRQEVARKGGLAVSRNKQHMAEIGRKGGQSVSKNREHMAQIGRKGGAASRGHR